MSSGIDHLMINCNDYASGVAFYTWLMPKIGYPEKMSFDQPTRMTGFVGEAGSVWVCAADETTGRQSFDKRRVGLREIAFRGNSREEIDRLSKEILDHGGAILDPPREYDYRPGYYSVFFTDPEGIKLEVVHY
jgi:glyoxylase I family protein